MFRHIKCSTIVLRRFSQVLIEQQAKNVDSYPEYFHLCDEFHNQLKDEGNALVKSMNMYPNFLCAEEEKSILEEIEPYMNRLRYEFDHWDDAIHGYRETERLIWNENNTKVLDRVREIAFPPNVAQLKHVHILDLAKDGYIKPHIDAVRFCGDTIAGLSLLSDSIMRLVNEKNSKLYANVLLKRRSLYVMNGTARYKYTHEILSNKISTFRDQTIIKDRRISVICRNEPFKEDVSPT